MKFSNGWDISLTNIEEDETLLKGFARDGWYWLEFFKKENKIVLSFNDAVAGKVILNEIENVHLL